MKKTLLIIFLVGLITNFAWAQITASEYNALMNLYQSTNGANWTNKTGWSSADPNVVQSVQGWYGVTTNAAGNVTQLALSNNNLLGPIPNEIGNLPNLIVLSLNNNQLSGSIPTTIGNLTNLEVLQLHVNLLGGSIPDQIGNLTKLSILRLNGAQFTGAIPSSIGNLTSLTDLDLTNNQLSGSIPSSIGNLDKLTFFHLRINQLTGPIPSTIGNMSALINVALDNNQLSGVIPSSIGNLSNLQVLWLQVNQLSGSIPVEIGNLNNLVYLALQGNQLSGTIPASIGNLTLLRNLDLTNNQLSGAIPNTIGNLFNLEFLHLRINQLSGQIPSTIGNMTALSNVAIDNNQLSGPIPSTMQNLQNLGALWLNSNQLIGNADGLTGLASISSLNSVRVDHNKLSFADFLELKQQKSQLVYSPQALVDAEKTLQAPLGSPFALTTTIDRNTTPASIYRWYKKVNGVITPLNESSTTGHTVELPAITQADNGTQYYYTITNTAAPGLTLTSHLQTLAATTCQVPVLDFQFEEVNGTHTFNPSVSNADNCNITYNWDFGDGTSSQEQVGNHDYAAIGSYTVVLTINYQCGTCPGSTLIKEYVVEIANNVLCQSIYCDGNGGVGIGTRKTQGFALSVYGKIRASDIIKVYPHNQWADFVFDNDYKLRPLSEVELFIKNNGHLPEIPSAAQVEKEGVDLGAMDAKLLQKIEELTLYIIKQDKEIQELKKLVKSKQ